MEIANKISIKMQILMMFSFINRPKLCKPALCEKVRALKSLKNFFFLICSGHFCLILKFVWSCKKLKWDKYANKKKLGRGQKLFTAFIQYISSIVYIHCMYTVYIQGSSGDGDASDCYKHSGSITLYWASLTPAVEKKLDLKEYNCEMLPWA